MGAEEGAQIQPGCADPLEVAPTARADAEGERRSCGAALDPW